MTATAQERHQDRVIDAFTAVDTITGAVCDTYELDEADPVDIDRHISVRTMLALERIASALEHIGTGSDAIAATLKDQLEDISVATQYGH